MRKLLPLLAAGAVVAAAAAADAAERLVIYTSQPTDQMTEVNKLFNQTHPGIQVEMFRSGTTEVVNKLQAEIAAGDPKPDLLLIADSIAMTALKNEGLFQPYREAPVKGFDKVQYDPDMTFFGTKMITTGIVYNTKAGVPRPTSWKDLLRPEVKGRVIMPSPLYSGAAVIHVGTVAAQPGFGWEYFERLARNGAVAGKGNGSVIDAVARGEMAYGVLIEYMAFGAKAKGSPVDFVFPDEGVTAINQPVGILKTARNVAAARKYVDFQLSRAAQEQAVRQKYFPIMHGVTPPEGYPKLGEIKIMEADSNVLLKGMEDVKKRFADLFGG